MKEIELIKGNAILITVLSKYIQYIRDIEGVDYVLDLDQRRYTDVKFTDEEWAILTEAAKNAS
jgi:hypothetical protein